MKKVLALILTAALTTALLTGCGNARKENTPAGATKENAAVETEAPEEAPASEKNGMDDLSIYTDPSYWSGLDKDSDITWQFVKEKHNKVLLIIPDTTAEFYAEIAATCDKKFTEAGYEFDSIGVNNDATSAIAAIETNVASGVDAIVIMAQDNTCDDALRAAMEAGVLVVSASAEIANYHHWLLQDNYDVGYSTARMAADWLKKNWPDETSGQYIVIKNDMTQATADKGRGCEEGMKELYPGGECVGTVSFTGNMDQIMADVETLLTQHPDTKAVVAMHNTFSLIALEAAKSVGLAKKGEFGVFGSALSEQVISCLTEGDTCYEGEIWMGDQGYQMAENTLKLLNGETLKRWYYAKNFPVSSENIATYYEDYYAE